LKGGGFEGRRIHMKEDLNEGGPEGGGFEGRRRTSTDDII
jgi:hypothetical protein